MKENLKTRKYTKHTFGFNVTEELEAQIIANAKVEQRSVASYLRKTIMEELAKKRIK